MLTDDDYIPRKVRPDLARNGPKRTLDALKLPPEPALAQAQGGPPPPPPPPPPSHADIKVEISALVDHAVRAGYEVINDTLEQGRAAADAHGKSQYHLSDATQDMSKLGKRMIALSRELGTTSFDLLAAAVRDPRLHATLRGKQHPGAQPPPEQPQPTGPVAIAVEIQGSLAATGTATPLAPQSRPIRPVARPLTPTGPPAGRPPIKRIGFGSTPAGGLRVIVRMPANQPPGRYQGFIVDAASDTTLSVLTVDVHA